MQSSIGSDIYLGGEDSLEHINYASLNSHESVDSLSGLFISDRLEDLPVVIENMPSIIKDEFSQDPFITYQKIRSEFNQINQDVESIDVDLDSNIRDNEKQTLFISKNIKIEDEKSLELDYLKDIDIITLTNGDDILKLNNNDKSTILDFDDGNDLAILVSKGLEPKIDNYYNLENIRWYPIDEDGNNIKNEKGDKLNYEFKVIELFEDKEKQITLGDYSVDSNTSERIEWEAEKFSLSEDTSKNILEIPEWMTLKAVDPTPYLVGDNQVIISTNIIKEKEIEDKFMLEIHVHDKREDGRGLVGLEMNLSWLEDSINLLESEYSKNNVFNYDHLPLFQNLGNLVKPNDDAVSNERRISINGLGAASLPNAGKGIALGKNNNKGNETLFARIPFIGNKDIYASGLQIETTLTPPAAGVELNPENILILDSRSKKVNVIEARPTQETIGNYNIKVREKVGNDYTVSNLSIVVREVNDPPEAIEKDLLDFNDLNIISKQDSRFEKSVIGLFKDEDDVDLEYTIESGPNWINIDKNTGLLQGTPTNEDVGKYNITIQADDLRGGLATQNLILEVLNVNDQPKINIEFELPKLLQGQSFTYRLPPNAFIDPDMGIDPLEKLTYEIVAYDKDSEVPKWISINKEEGTISGQAGIDSVGVNSFGVKATDNYGLDTIYKVSLTVENINDAPKRTSSLQKFLEAQVTTLEGEKPISEDDMNAIFTGLERVVDINNWFQDPDLIVDPNEYLTITVEYDNGVGDVVEIAGDSNDSGSKDSIDWITFDKTKGLLKFSPKLDDLGEHILMVKATDKAGLAASALVPVLVRHRNSSPTLETKFISNLVSDNRNEGIQEISTNFSEGSEMKASDIEINISLKEEANVSIDFPLGLFSDPDLNIDTAEKIEYEMLGGEGLFKNSQANNKNPFLTFDANNLSIRGSTVGLGAYSNSPNNSWISKLRAKDNSGEYAEISLNFNLKRTANEIDLKVKEESLIRSEGDSVALKDFLELNINPREGDLVNIVIEENISNSALLELVRMNSNKATPILKKEAHRWEFKEKSIQEALNIFEETLVRVPNDQYAIGSFSLKVSVQTKFGNTSLVSEIVEKTINYDLLSKANKPIWIQNEGYRKQSSGLDFLYLSDIVKSESPDPREIIGYEVSIPESRKDLIIANIKGSKIGQSIGNKIELSESEWQESLVRINSRNTDNFDVSIRSFSVEPDSGLRRYSDTYNIELIPTPFIDKPPEISVIAPSNVQRSGEPSKLTLDISNASTAKTAWIEIESPIGTKITSDQTSIKEEVSIDLLDFSKTKYIFRKNLVENKKYSRVEFNVESSENFRGELSGAIKIVASSDDSNQEISSLESFSESIEKGLARESSGNLFKWDVAQVARTPEFDLNQKEYTNTAFNNLTGQLNIGVRRGKSLTGTRNSSEVLTLSVRNIPNGYVLAEKEGDSYKAVGATDAFGTMTLFTIPNTENQNINEYSYINNKNLYLIEQYNTDNSLANTRLELSLVSRITDQPGGDSRSSEVTSYIDLKDIASKRPNLKGSENIIDPIIIDLDGEGLSLTSLDASNSSLDNIKFEMLPSSKPIPTAWLKTNENNKHEEAFLFINNTNNDVDNIVEVKSITELFSEYFQSKDRQRTFYSGSSALSSIDSNSDNSIDNKDNLWNSIMLWFDNGDGISQSDEIKPLNKFIDSIDLGSITSIITQPNWSSNNKILRRLNAKKGDSDIYLYDVGLKVAPAGKADLSLELSSSKRSDSLTDSESKIELRENGEAVVLNINSESSKEWSNELHELTLVRIGGLPEEITPTLGVIDSRGDWLFTWSDLVENGKVVELIPDSDWSGNANLEVLISQINADGTIISSPLTSIGIDVIGVADTPLLKLNNPTIQEGGFIKLSEMIGIASLLDNDGSEELGIELSNLPAGTIIKKSDNNNRSSIIGDNNGKYSFKYNEIENINITPPSNFSGKLEFQITAIAKEINNDSIAKTSRNALINITGIADKPNSLEENHTKPSLYENAQIQLASLLNKSSIDNLLNDRDGSEEIRYKLRLPNEADILNSKVDNWRPITASKGAKEREIIFSSNDLDKLVLLDKGLKDIEKLNVFFTPISREVSNGNLAEGNEIKISVDFIRNAKSAQLIKLEPQLIKEDFQSISLNNFFEAKPENTKDVLSYIVSNLSEGLYLTNNKNEKVYDYNNSDTFILREPKDYFVQINENLSGKFGFNLSIVSNPNNGGSSASSGLDYIDFDVLGVADTPNLLINQLKEQPLNIKENGWLDLALLKPQVISSDKDGSEELGIIVGFKNSKGEMIDLPANYKFNILTKKFDDKRILLESSDLDNLSLYIGEIAEDSYIDLAGYSKDGKDEKVGEGVTLTIKANAMVRVPLLEVRGVMEGYEDNPIPILADQQGVVKAQLRGSGAGQELSLEISNLPQGSMLVEVTNNSSKDGKIISKPLNTDEKGNLVQSLKLPYYQWNKIHWLNPVNQYGSYEFSLKATSSGNNNKQLSTEYSKVQIQVKAFNDRPEIKNYSDLESIMEDEYAQWDLLSRFSDVDNALKDIKIKANLLEANGVESILPSWLLLNEQGILSGKPSNKDVGIYSIKITATDPLGESNSLLLSLEVGDINAPPKLHSSAFHEWTASKINNVTIYSKNIDLREEINIDLSKAFSDEDSINGDILTFKLSNDGEKWGPSIDNLAKIEDNLLNIKASSKNRIGNEKIYIKATDLVGSSVTQQLNLNVRNINDPPQVNRSSANLIRSGYWGEDISIKQDSSNWEINLEGIFSDADIGDTIDQIVPSMPSWLSYESSKQSTGGKLTGKPLNINVGTLPMEWQAIDNRGDTAIYRLNLNVENINDNPYIIKNPDLSELGPTIKGNTLGYEDKYSRLNLEALFADPDSIHGDVITYQIKSIVNQETNQKIDNEWADITYRSSETPDYKDKMLIEPVFYKIDGEGNLDSKVNYKQIKNMSPNTKLRVLLEVSDDRNVDLKGLIGLDLDVTFSSSIKLVKDSTIITDKLPLFRSVLEGDGGVRLTAGSAPDGGLNIGESVGNKPKEILASFDLILSNPNKRFVVGLSPGKGLNRDGIMGRSGEELNDLNSIIHSFSSRAGADLEIFAPNNDQVGKYKLTIEAKDQQGELIETSINLDIQNTNDKPILVSEGKKLLTDWISRGYKESEVKGSPKINLFDDVDIRYGDEIQVLLNNKENSDKENISLTNNNGSISIELKPPSGITEVITEKFSLTAKDKSGESLESEVYEVSYIPKPQLTSLTKANKKLLDKLELGNMAKKNVELNLSNVLNINAPELMDKIGDEAYLKIRVPSKESNLSLLNSDDTSFIKVTTGPEDSLFSIDLKRLSSITRNPYGNINGLNLTVPDNQLEIIPRDLLPKPTAGLSIDIWTETRVKGDKELKFGLISSDTSQLWIPIDNISPVFKGASALKIDESFFKNMGNDDLKEVTNLDENKEIGNNVLFDLSEMFIDLDKNDISIWEVEIPKKLNSLLKFNSSNGEISFNDKVKGLDDLPQGNYKILARSKDSSGIKGDPTGFSNGILRLFIGSGNSSNDKIQALDFITRSESSEFNKIFNDYDRGNEIDDSKKEVINIMERLNIDINNTTQRDKFVKKLEEGKLSILAREDKEKPMIMFDTSRDSDNVLIDSEVKDAERSSYMSRPLFADKVINDAPLGEIDFTIDTKGDLGTIVELYLDDSHTNLDSLIKTTSDGTPYLFDTQTIKYDEEENGDLDQWLSNLEYGINYYGNLPSGKHEDLSDVKITFKDEVSEQLALVGFNFENLSYIDGSAYLIDLDDDSTIDLISLLLIDQGFFDTNPAISVIGDPLIPIQTEVVNEDIPNMSQDEISATANTPNRFITFSPKFNYSGNKNISKSAFSTPRLFNKNDSYDDLKQLEESDVSYTSYQNNIVENTSEGSGLFSDLYTSFQKNINSALKSFMELANDKNITPLAAMLGIIVGPMGLERLTTFSAKKIKTDFRLKVKRRSPEFKGEWIIPFRRGSFLNIKYSELTISLEKVYMNDGKNLSTNIPGFDSNYRSLLSKAMPLCKTPGRFIKELDLLHAKLSNGNALYVDWDKWLTKNFSLGAHSHISNKAELAFKDLLGIARDRHLRKEFIDVVMFAQIHDCRYLFNLE